MLVIELIVILLYYTAKILDIEQIIWFILEIKQKNNLTIKQGN